MTGGDDAPRADGAHQTAPVVVDDGAGPETRRRRLTRQIGDLIRAISDGDDTLVEQAVVALSSRQRIFAPLTFAIGAFAMLFQGLKLLFTNWRLSLLQVLPAMWLWAAMLDLKLHVLKGKQFHLWTGRLAVVLVLAVMLVTMAGFYLNAVFAFAIARPGKPDIRPGFALARHHARVVLPVGLVIGAALGVSAVVVPRWGLGWFALSLGIVIGVMMLTYVLVPSRLIGITASSNYSRRDQLTATVVAGAVGGMICTPPYVIGRVGLVMLGSRTLLPLGVVLLALGFTLQAGATGAVKAVKLSAKLVAGTTVGDAQPDEPRDRDAAPDGPTAPAAGALPSER